MRRALVRAATAVAARPSPWRLPATQGRWTGDEPAWAAEARRKYQEEQRRRAARRRQVETVELSEGNDFNLGDDVVVEDPSDELPVVEDDGWLLFQNHDSFPTDVAESWNPAKDDETAGAVLRSVEEAKFHCQKMNYGGFVQKWSLIYFFKRVPPRRLVAARQHCKAEDRGMFDLYVAPEFEGEATLVGEIGGRWEAAAARGEAPQKREFSPGFDDDDDELAFGSLGEEAVGDAPRAYAEEDAFERDLLDGERTDAVEGSVPPPFTPDATPAGGGAGVSQPPPQQQQQQQQQPPPAALDHLPPHTPIRCARDITVKGVVAIRKGTEGFVVGPATSGDPRRVHVRFERREDGKNPELNVTAREVQALD